MSATAARLPRRDHFGVDADAGGRACAGPLVTVDSAPARRRSATVPAVLAPVVASRRPVPTAWERLGEELLTWFKTLASAAVYATLIVTFVCQVARVEGQSMSPTLEDQDRLIVNKLIYRLSAPKRGDIVMLYYPVNPDKSFVKRVIAEEGEEVRILDGKVYVDGELSTTSTCRRNTGATTTTVR